MALSLTEAHVAARYRVLREVGLVSKYGRGRFACNMTALDGARLLIAVMGAHAIADTQAIAEIIGQSECTIVEGDNELLASDIGDLVFEQAVAHILQSCLAHRLGDDLPLRRLGHNITITVSPSDLSASILRPGFHAQFHPPIFRGTAPSIRMTEEMTASDRLWLRADRAGLRVTSAVEVTDLLELAPSIGLGDGPYRATH